MGVWDGEGGCGFSVAAGGGLVWLLRGSVMRGRGSEMGDGEFLLV